MGAAAVRSLTLQRIQLFGSAAQLTSYTRKIRPGLRAVPASTSQRFVTARLRSTNSWKSLSISSVMDSSSVTTNDSIVTRVSMKPSFGSPRANANLVLRKGLASGVSRDSESASSTSDSLTHQAEESRSNEQEKKSSQRMGVFAIGAGIFSTILSYIIKLCGGGYTPIVKQAEKDIDKVADFVDEGAKLVVKVADEIEAMAHVADLSAQEAEDLALKVEAKTKVVKETLDAIADVLEGDKKLSTVLTDYAHMKKTTTDTTEGTGSSSK